MKILLLTLLVLLAITPLFAAPLSTDEEKFLAGYEKTRAALAADDLDAARTAARAMKPDAEDMAASDDLASARAAFKKLSEKAIPLAQGRDGFFIAYCPMADASWVQTSKSISNPYYGKEMLHCGVIK